MQAESEQCVKCGSRLRQDGLCPQCLLAVGLESEENASTGSLKSVVTVTQELPQPSELTGLFEGIEVLELVGSGGMGAVYKVRQKKLDRIVALKILLPTIGNAKEKQSFETRFEQEAKALAKLNHPGIVTIYDFGTIEKYCYIIMEFIDGVSLRETLLEQQLSAAEALLIVPKLCDALQYAHDQGVVHRDIKPENILLTMQGDVKIADFGLAKLNDRDTSITETRQVLGTPKYMAPEQLEGAKNVDHRADIYSLGVVFYELLTGELPLGRFAPPSKKVEVNVSLDEVVLRSLEKEPVQRYQRASEVRSAIDCLTSMRGSVYSVSGPKSDTTLGKLAHRLGPSWMLVILNLLVLVYFYCLFKFFAFEFREQVGRAELAFGSPVPWLAIVGEQPSDGQFRFQWQTSFLTITLLWAIAAHLILFACRAIDLARGGVGRLFSPNVSAVAWGVTVVAILSYANVRVPKLSSTANAPDSNKVESPEIRPAMLRAAAENGDLVATVKALQGGVDVNYKFEDGKTALISAAINGHASYATALLVLGSNVNEQDGSGKTALMYAVEESQKGVFFAIDSFARDLREFQSRRERLFSDPGLTPEERAARAQGLKFKIAGVDQSLVDTYDPSSIKVDIDYDLVDHEGESLLIKAAARGDRQLVETLASADVLLTDSRGRNAIWHAAANERFEFLREQILRQPIFHPSNLVSEQTLTQVPENAQGIFVVLRALEQEQLLVELIEVIDAQLKEIRRKIQGEKDPSSALAFEAREGKLEEALKMVDQELRQLYKDNPKTPKKEQE